MHVHCSIIMIIFFHMFYYSVEPVVHVYITKSACTCTANLNNNAISYTHNRLSDPGVVEPQLTLNLHTELEANCLNH